MKAGSSSSGERLRHAEWTNPAWLYLAVALTYIAAAAILASSLPAHFGFPLDDSWIHQTIGRNFAWYRSLGYLPHQRSSGSTSLLWTLLLSVNYTVLPKLSPVLYTLCINLICLVAIGLLLLRLALRDGMRPQVALLWAVAPAVNGNFLWLAFTGMEHLLFLALSLSAIHFWFVESPRAALRTALLTGLSLGLLCMTRPEGIVLAGGLLLLFHLAQRTPRQAALAGLLAATLAALPFSVNLFTSGSLLPVTYKGRQWMYFAGQGSSSMYRMQLLQQWVTRPLKAVSMLDGAALTPQGRLAVYSSFALLLLLCVVALYSLLSQRRVSTLVLCAWAALHSLLYVVMLPISGHGGRYQPFLLLLLTPFLSLGLYRSLRLLKTSARASSSCAAGMLLVVAAFSLPLWRNVLSNGIEHIQDSHGAMASFLNRSQLTGPVAVFDIGRIGYELKGNLVDLGGLTDSAYIAYLYGNRVPEYLQQHSISLIVLPVDSGPENSVIGGQLHLIDNPNLRLEPLHRACTPYPIWHVGWVETRHAAQCQELYRIHFR